MPHFSVPRSLMDWMPGSEVTVFSESGLLELLDVVSSSELSQPASARLARAAEPNAKLMKDLRVMLDMVYLQWL